MGRIEAEIEAALRRGDAGRAAGLARRALVTSPQDSATLQLLGISLATGGRGEAAVGAFRRRSWVKPTVLALLDLVSMLAALGDARTAKPLRRALALAPDSIQAWDLGCRAERAAGRLLDEARCLGRICALTASAAHEDRRGECLAEAGASEAAIRWLRTRLRRQPQRLAAARRLFGLIRTMGVRAEPATTTASASSFDRGVALLQAGEIEAAATTFHANFADDPECVGSRVAHAAAIHLLTAEMPRRISLAGVGTVETGAGAGRLRLTPLEVPPRGRFLFGYDAGSVLLPETDERFRRHSNQWESRAIARALLKRGFAVDLVGINDPWPDAGAYVGVLCLHGALRRHAQQLRPDCRRIMLLTGSSPDFQNRQEDLRRRDLLARSGIEAPPVRRLSDVEGELASLRMADVCWLLGNQVTHATYEADVQPKIRLLAPSGSQLRDSNDAAAEPEPGRWLWFSGLGAVLKGLDRVVEIFLRRPDWRLDIVGPAAEEPWFQSAYGARLAQSANIALHGTLSPVSFDFAELAAACIGHLAPSASEGLSTAAVTCIQAGLYPVISRECGIDLPAGCGEVLDDSGLAAIEAAIERVHRLTPEERRRQIAEMTVDARKRFSRVVFLRAVDGLLDASLDGVGGVSA